MNEEEQPEETFVQFQIEVPEGVDSNDAAMSAAVEAAIAMLGAAIATPEPVALTEPVAPESEVFPLAEPGEYYVGLWSGLPNYKCPYCHYATLEGSGAVELHILAKIDQGGPQAARHLKALELKEN